MSFTQAVKGAKIEFFSTRGLLPRLHCVAKTAKIFTMEAFDIVKMVGYGLQAFWTRHSLESFLPFWNHKASTVMTDARYGPKPRNLLDIYYPHLQAHYHSSLTDTNKHQNSVVLFVHGGVWSTGQRWHYAPLARTLARNNTTACIMSYSLYPDASALDIVEEINLALDWVIAKFGKDKHSKVTVVGHSSGAHCLMVAMLKRINQSRKMPSQIIAICGVYDVATHYKYEKDHGVHEISAMKRAMGGIHNFKKLSPTCILNDVLHQQNSSSIPLHKLPKVILITSLADHVVPSEQSEALYKVLLKLGCIALFLKYRDIIHSHFVTKCWTSNHSSWVSDFIKLVKSEVQIHSLSQGLAVREAAQVQTQGVSLNLDADGISS